MQNLYYILDEKKVVPVNNVLEWAKFFETADRVVNRTKLGEVTISTVFLGIDHNFFEKDKPLLFETMIFGDELNEETWRYSTWEEAEEGHHNAVKYYLESRKI